MDLITFLSTFGGLISMYFGLGMVDLLSNIFDFSGKMFTILKFIKCNFIFSKYEGDIIKFLIRIIIFSLMVYQLYEISDTYFEGKEKIDIKFSNEFKMPKIFLYICNGLHTYLLCKKIYPDLFNSKTL